ncbi:cadherin domain protein [Dictyocaulus viviparus]|uniref:Cadherin domain protein n=1 Tax=Dictyocaulus viviparus TaxID=29172 RepID=A0A0D8Y0X2_DICVI|nr:cadherin domain protein [Dictyocaulus viviparus]
MTTADRFFRRSGVILSGPRDVRFLTGGIECRIPFSLLGPDLVLSCSAERRCLDFEQQQTHHVLIVDLRGMEFPPIYVKINVVDVNDNRPQLKVFDESIRLSHNKLIVPFIVQVLDRDSPSLKSNQLSLSASAANFLSFKEISENLYQIDVSGFAPSGLHELTIRVYDENSSDELTVQVQVQNSPSTAHFRRSKYLRSITTDKLQPGNQLVHVELEGVPIDEARFVVLQRNPGWLSIEDYGGRIFVSKNIANVEIGKYSIEIGATDRMSNALLAKTLVEITVMGDVTNEKKTFSRSLYKQTRDREHSTEISIPIELHNEGVFVVESVIAIDENGQQTTFQKSSITITKAIVIFQKKQLETLRAVNVQLVSEAEREIIKNERNELRRPVFSRPWTKDNRLIEINILEELPLGHVIYTLPAINPLNGSAVPLKMKGDKKKAFILDSRTGAISIAERLDFDSMTPSDQTFSLKLSAGLNDYETFAELKISVLNVDDNAPALNKGLINGELSIPENLAPSTTIAQLQITDRDSMGDIDNFSILKIGSGSELFAAHIENSSLIVTVAANVTLDREVMERHTVHLVVFDPAGNEDSATFHIILLDVNDNTPRFSQSQYAMQAVDNWPIGIIVDRLTAFDNDMGRNAHVVYSLADGSSQYLTINPITGELSVARELAGIAREQPYELVILAEDAGSSSLSTSVRIKLKVSEPSMEREGRRGQVHFINPPVDYVLKVMENTRFNEHVYSCKARLNGIKEDKMNVKYSLEDPSMDDQHFAIDESSGDVFVIKELDFEIRKYYTVCFFLLELYGLITMETHHSLFGVLKMVCNTGQSKSVFFRSKISMLKNCYRYIAIDKIISEKVFEGKDEEHNMMDIPITKRICVHFGVEHISMACTHRSTTVLYDVLM